MGYQSYKQELEDIVRLSIEFGDNKQEVMARLWKKFAAEEESLSSEGLKLLDLDFSGFPALCERLGGEPKSNIWFSFFIICYLIEKRETPITPNHVYSGYIKLEKSPPRNLEQNLRDLVHKYKVIEMEDGRIILTAKGKEKMYPFPEGSEDNS